MMKSGIVVRSTHYEVEGPFFRQWICQNITQYFWNSKKKKRGGKFMVSALVDGVSSNRIGDFIFYFWRFPEIIIYLRITNVSDNSDNEHIIN